MLKYYWRNFFLLLSTVSFTVYLRETDYGQDEGENVEVTVSLNQQIFTDVAIELLLLTVSELQAIGLEGMVPNYPPPHAAKSKS